MAGFGENVVHLKDEYGRNDIADEVWLQDIGRKGWYLITRDLNIRRNPAELEALRTHYVGAFFLGGKNRPRWELVKQLVRNWPHIKNYASKTKRPFAFRIPIKGGPSKYSRLV